MNDGIHDLGADAYHADPADQPSLSSTIARKLLDTSPLHAWTDHPKLNPNYQPRESNRAFDIGGACHSMLLEGHDAVTVVDHDSWRTNDAKAQREDAYAFGKIPLLAHEAETVLAMCKTVQAQIRKRGLLTDGKPEQTLIWHDGQTSCRARVDWLTNDHTLVQDIKTTSRTANPDKFSRTLYDLGYHVQAEFYCRGVEALTGRRPEFELIVCETAAPFAVTVHSLSPAGWSLAAAQVDYAIELWGRCLARNEWPGYDARVAFAEPPGWLEAQWLERELREEVAA